MATDEIVEWSTDSRMQMNTVKTKDLLINFSKSPTEFHTIIINGQSIDRVSHAVMLGVSIRDTLRWNRHIETITSKASQRLFMLTRLKKS